MGKLSVVGAFIVILTWQSLTIDSARLRSQSNACLEEVGGRAEKRECWVRAAKQNWTFTNNTLKNQVSGKCLKGDGKPPYMSNCHPPPDQKKYVSWFYDGLRMNVTADGRVVHGRFKHSCLALVEEYDYVAFVPCNEYVKDHAKYTE
jgi:hypothetical protein